MKLCSLLNCRFWNWKFCRRLLTALLCVIGGPLFGATAELLTNGGFEPPYNAVSGTNPGGTVSGNFPSGWTDNSRNQGRQTNNTYSEETTGTVSGSAFKAIVAADSAGANPLPALYLYQTMNAVPGRTLTASVWMKASANTTATMIFLLTSPPYTTRASRSCNVTTSWQQFTLTFTPTVAEIDRMEIRCTSGVTIWLDEASITTSSGTAPIIVSPSGSDAAGSGTLAAPYQTIAKAMASVYPGDTVQLRAGTYRETITPTQSGQASAPITITNYDGEAVTVTGADVVSGPWTAGSNGIYTADVNVDLGEGFNQIFVDGTMVNEAREPNNTGADLLHPTTSSMTVTATATQSSTTAKVDSSIATSFASKPDNFYAGARLHAGINQKWAWQGGTIGGSTGNTLSITAAAETGSWWWTGTGTGYVFGLLGLLDTDNEWFLQHNASAPHTLSLRINGQAAPTGHLVEIRNRSLTLNCNSKNYIVVRGLNLRCGDVQMNGTGNVLDHCDLAYLSHFLTFTSAINNVGLKVGGTGNTVSYCTIHDTAGCGIYASGSGHLITRNTIYHTDYSGTYASGIALAGNSSGDTITFNTAHHSGRDIMQLQGGSSGGVEVKQGGHFIAYNDFYEPGQMAGDLGCIYTFSSNAQGATGSPTRIAYNWCHDNTQPAGLRILIYLDNWDRNYIVDHNVCWNGLGDAGIRMNGPNDGHKIYHNTLFNCDDANTHTFTLAFSSSGNPEPAFWYSGGSYTAPDVRNDLYLASTPDTQLTNSSIRDFRPKAGAAAIDSATLIAGYNDSYTGAAPDQGAYEAGGAYWVPGVNGWSIDQPGVTSSLATNVAGTSATANGTLISAGTATTTVALYWGGSDGGTAPGAWSNVATLGTNYTGTYLALTQPITGLMPTTIYWYRYRATNSNGDYWSDSQTFTTLALPVVTLNSATTITLTGVTLGGTVNPNGAATTAQFEYGLTTGYGSTASVTLSPNNGTSAQSVSANLSGLQAGTLYHYRLSATNNGGTSNTSDGTFTTLTLLQQWKLTNLGDAHAPDAGDPNENGITNLIEYALGGDPAGNATGLTILPQVGRSALNTLQITFTRFLDRSDLVLTVLAADSLLGPWTPLARSTAGGAFVILEPGATAPESGTGNERSVTATDLYQVTDPAHPRRFLKLEVAH